MLHKQSPRPGAFWAPRPGAGGMILPVQSPNRASRRCHRRRKKLPPPTTQTQKTARPRSDMLQGLLFFRFGPWAGAASSSACWPCSGSEPAKSYLPPPASEPRTLPAGGFVCAAYSKQRSIICGSLQKINVPLTNIRGGGGRMKQNKPCCLSRQGKYRLLYGGINR